VGYALNNVTTGDRYTPATTLEALPSSSKVNGQIANNAAYIQLQRRQFGDVGPGDWEPEVFMAPQTFNWARPNICGIRARSGKAGTPAQVTLEVVA
jgi:hypothetical protein